MSSGGEALCLPAPAFPLLTSLPAAPAQFQRTHLRSCALLGPPRPALAGAPPSLLCLLALCLVEALWALPRSIVPHGVRAPSSCCAGAVPRVSLCFPPCSGRFLGRRWEVPG